MAALSPTKIDRPIIDCYVVHNPAHVAPVPVKKPELIIYDRDGELEGITYKIKPPVMNCAMYITINNITLEDGTKRPIEIFINSKQTEHHQWVTALTRMISAVLRKPGPIEFAIDELEQVFDPQGGYWDEGKMTPSLVAHVGKVLRKHCEKIGAIEGRELTPEQRVVIEEKLEEHKANGGSMMLCGECREKAVVFSDGCMTCTACGESKCS